MIGDGVEPIALTPGSTATAPRSKASGLALAVLVMSLSLFLVRGLEEAIDLVRLGAVKRSNRNDHHSSNSRILTSSYGNCVVVTT